jgi:hypothetical protein
VVKVIIKWKEANRLRFRLSLLNLNLSLTPSLLTLHSSLLFYDFLNKIVLAEAHDLVILPDINEK